ncbi:unnamed protein product [Ectocarpus sp. 6 AP-2014]
MAWCRLALLVRLTLSISLYLVVQCLSILGSDDLALPSQDRPRGNQKRAQVTSLEETTDGPARHGMHMKVASLTPTARGSSVAALGSAGASLTVASRRSLRSFTPSGSGRKWQHSSRRGSSERLNGSVGSSCGDDWNNRSVAGGGGGGGVARGALSYLAPAVAPRAGTSALFVVSSVDPAVSLATTPEAKLAGSAAAGAEGSVFAAGRALCRPLVRTTPLRFNVAKPSRTELFLAPNANTRAPGPSYSAADTGSADTTEMRCGGGGGGGGGGMISRFTWLESVNSTMDEVKTLIVNQEGSDAKRVFAVAAREQLRGRGTKGRAWIGLPGNVFLTVAIPLDRIPVPLSLISLRVGTLIAPEIQRRLPRHHQEERPPLSPPPFPSASPQGARTAKAAEPEPEPKPEPEPPRVSLKWPNDVLLGGSKVAGVLIEAELPFLLIGIGVNVRNKPEVPQNGPDRGRPAACLADFGADSTDEAVRELSAALTEKLCSWASGTDSASTAVAEWSRWVNWSLPLEIRDEGRAVRPIGVAPDGRLRVVDPATGEEELLTTEYLL